MLKKFYDDHFKVNKKEKKITMNSIWFHIWEITDYRLTYIAMLSLGPAIYGSV